MVKQLLQHAGSSPGRLVRWLGGQEPVVLITLLLVVFLTWGFVELADEVNEGSTGAFDEKMVLMLRQPDNPAQLRGPLWLQESGRDATALGGYGWLIFFTLATTGFLWLDRKGHLALFLLGSVAGGYLVSTALKNVFQRPRPDFVQHFSHVYNSPSFPSGHSMNSAVVFLTLGALVAMSLARRRLKIYVICVAMLISMLVGMSRVYLGVHYPTDVLAGWMAGLVWALLCALLGRWLQRRGQVETPTALPDEPVPDELAH